jgi:uncharacterized membrane protein YccC
MSDTERVPLIFGREFAEAASETAYRFAQLVERLELAISDAQTLEKKITDLDEKLTNCITAFSAFLQRADEIEARMDAISPRVDAPLDS